MRNIPKSIRKRIENLLIYVPGDGDGGKSAVDSDDAGEFAVAAFLEEFDAVGCGCFDEVCDVAERRPRFMCAGSG